MREGHAVGCLGKAQLSGIGNVGRAGLHRPVKTGRRRSAAELPWIEPLRRLIQLYPTFGYQHLWALLRGKKGSW